MAKNIYGPDSPESIETAEPIILFVLHNENICLYDFCACEKHKTWHHLFEPTNFSSDQKYWNTSLTSVAFCSMGALLDWLKS